MATPIPPIPIQTVFKKTLTITVGTRHGHILRRRGSAGIIWLCRGCWHWWWSWHSGSCWGNSNRWRDGLHRNITHRFYTKNTRSQFTKSKPCGVKGLLMLMLMLFKWSVPGMTVCLKSSSFRRGRKQSILSQVISHKSEYPVRESALWKIPAVSITSSMFFRDSGIASSCAAKSSTQN